MRTGWQRSPIRSVQLNEHAARAPKPAEERELVVARGPYERMITVQKCNTRRRLAVHELCRAVHRDVDSGGIRCSVRAPFGYLARVGVPINVRAGEEIGTRVSLIHEVKGKPCVTADSNSTCALRARATRIVRGKTPDANRVSIEHATPRRKFFCGADLSATSVRERSMRA